MDDGTGRGIPLHWTPLSKLDRPGKGPNVSGVLGGFP